MNPTFFLWTAVSFVIATVFASFFEWTLHRFIMHRPVKFFRYPFERHALIHHHIFKADETYHLINEEDKHTIPMAWWNGPAIIAVGMIPFVAGSIFLKSSGFTVGAFIACCGYYAAYEYIHWCMHLPRKRPVERSGIFFRLNGHHLLHHRYMGKNFNVVFPLADLCLGTLLLRSKIHFKQAIGPCVPDVQPKVPQPELAAVS
ncbi:MAG TPA: fatty acid hydroxylase [Verrucomicrobiae bacterium]|nr:fatty acid hydroxylase [Verrucomicrobiae bacterium]